MNLPPKEKGHGCAPLKGWTLEQDMAFLSGKFFDYEIPKELNYLKHYFKDRRSRTFLKYYLVVGDCRWFSEHTGIFTAFPFIFALKRRYLMLTELYDHYKKQFTEESMNMIYRMENKKIKLNELLTKYQNLKQ